MLAADLRPQLLPKLIANFEKDFDDDRVELRPRTSQNLFAGGVEALRLAIRTIAGDRVQRVGYSKDASADRNFFSAHSAGITAPVVVLLMAEDDLGRAS